MTNHGKAIMLRQAERENERQMKNGKPTIDHVEILIRSEELHKKKLAGVLDWVTKLGEGVYLLYGCGECWMYPLDPAKWWRCAIGVDEEWQE